MKTKMIIIILACVLLACFTLGVTDVVRMANTAMGEEHVKDRLIGVFVTTEYLDLFDADGYFNDHANSILSGGEISEAESAEYQGKRYATLSEKSYTSEETGKTFTTKEYAFEGLEGFSYFSALYTDGTSTYQGGSGDEAISDGHIAINSTDAGDSISLEGTIYISATGGPTLFYYNPVYQTAQGDVYTMAGQGMSYGDEITSGMSGSHEMKEETTATFADKTESIGSTIKVTVCFMDEPKSVTLVQFDSENNVLSRKEYMPGKLPDRLTAESGAEYIIVETVSSNTELKDTITRELYQLGDETLFAFYCRDDGICVKQYCGIDWND